jgi:hypothetical protein
MPLHERGRASLRESRVNRGLGRSLALPESRKSVSFVDRTDSEFNPTT